MSDEQHWETYRPPASPAERQGEPVVAPRTPYDDLPVVAPVAPRRRRGGRWFWAGLVGTVVVVVGGLVVLGAASGPDEGTSIYTMYTAHDYEHLVAALREGPGTEVESVYFTSFDAQLHSRVGERRQEMYAFDDGEGLKAQQLETGAKRSFDLARLSATDFLRVCASARAVPDHDGVCVITPAPRREATAWIRVETQAPGETKHDWVDYDPDGDAVAHGRSY